MRAAPRIPCLLPALLLSFLVAHAGLAEASASRVDASGLSAAAHSAPAEPALAHIGLAETDPASGPTSGYPETRIRASGISGADRIGVELSVNHEAPWGCGTEGIEKASGEHESAWVHNAKFKARRDRPHPGRYKGFKEAPRMSAADVKVGLGGASGRRSGWAYALHDHHLYPKWLGGREKGPLLRIRGYEHLKDLEPALRDHVMTLSSEITAARTKEVRRLLRAGRVSQEQITDVLVDFYRTRYPSLTQEQIRDTLARGLRR